MLSIMWPRKKECKQRKTQIIITIYTFKWSTLWIIHNVSYHNTNDIVNINARKTIYGNTKILTIYTEHITSTNLIEQKILISSYKLHALKTL